MGNFFEWDAGKFGLQIPEMDNEHRQIVNCMNQLHELHDAQAGQAKLATSLGELVRVTAKHFADEERYMQSISFPEASRHSLVHQQLLQRIGEFQQQFAKSGKLTDDFFMFLRMWLKSHICGIDTKYAAHSRSA